MKVIKKEMCEKNNEERRLELYPNVEIDEKAHTHAM